LATQRIPLPHANVGQGRGTDQNKPVAADAEVAVADDPGQPRRIGRHRLADTIDVDIVIAGALHFDEPHSLSFHLEGVDRSSEPPA
jgi:hypothetical protein